MAQQLLWLKLDSQIPASNENAHKLIQSFAAQPQTVVLPLVPAW